MPTPFIMPKMDMDQETVTIIEWLKKEGDQVQKGEPAVVIETDKITSDIEAPASGTLAQIQYRENEAVPVTQVIAYILGEGETAADLPEEPKPAAEVREKQMGSALPIERKEVPATPVAVRMAEAKDIHLTNIPHAGPKVTKEDVEHYLSQRSEVKPRVETPATPAARRIAAEQGVNIGHIEGSGPRGRVQAEDVEAFGPSPFPQTTSPKPVATSEIKALSTMRKRIAERLTLSYQSTPHIYLTAEADMNEAEASRSRMNALAAKEGSPAISLTAYLVRVVAWGLRRHPYLNASFTEDGIRFWDAVNIGVATALENGLIVPVIHNADTQTARELNECLRNLTRRAREGTLSPEEIQDGTFTISNLGMYGIESFTAIINPPQSAILAVGSLVRKQVVIDENDTVAVRPMMKLTLAADHRIVDGAVAAEFLSDVVKALETPEVLLF